jgi:hypothetical protein
LASLSDKITPEHGFYPFSRIYTLLLAVYAQHTEQARRLVDEVEQLLTEKPYQREVGYFVHDPPTAAEYEKQWQELDKEYDFVRLQQAVRNQLHRYL